MGLGWFPPCGGGGGLSRRCVLRVWASGVGLALALAWCFGLVRIRMALRRPGIF
jgi:hypothetical protein